MVSGTKQGPAGTKEGQLFKFILLLLLCPCFVLDSTFTFLLKSWNRTPQSGQSLLSTLCPVLHTFYNAFNHPPLGSHHLSLYLYVSYCMFKCAVTSCKTSPLSDSPHGSYFFNESVSRAVHSESCDVCMLCVCVLSPPNAIYIEAYHWPKPVT